MIASIGVLATSLSLLDPDLLARVADPDHPDAIGRSETHAVLASPPPAGTPWQVEPVPVLHGFVASEGVAETHADLWHADGITGSGVRIAVFDIGWYGPVGQLDEVDALTTHDCWVNPSCDPPIDFEVPRFSFEDGAHGVGCAEVVRDTAPGAEILLVRVPTLAAFENAMRWAIRADVDLITMSMSFFNHTFYDGAASTYDNLLRELEQAEILLVTSAGNDARSHWRGSWTDADGDGRLDFWGENYLELSGSGSVTAYVNWNQHGRCGDTDLDAELNDGQGWVHGRSRDRQRADADQCRPVETVRGEFDEDGRIRLEVTHEQGVHSGLEVDVMLRSGEVVRPIPSGAITDPASHPLAFAVGAVRVTGYRDNPAEGFSSWGPNNAGHPKPDIAGPDGVTTSTYGARGFYGTSAAAPAVAGMIALLMEDDPALTPREAAERLQALAINDRGLAHSDSLGAGRAVLPVRNPQSLGCGERPMLAMMVLLPLGWFRRRR